MGSVQCTVLPLRDSLPAFFVVPMSVCVWPMRVVLFVAALCLSHATELSADTARFRAVMRACHGELARLCPGQSQTRPTSGAGKCLMQHGTSLSSACHTALAGALSNAMSHRPGSTGTQRRLDRLCMPSVVRRCRAEALDLMLNPLNTEGTSLIECAKRHSMTISAACEDTVAKLTKDGFAKPLLTCGAKFTSLCPTQVVSLLAKANQVSGKLQTSDFMPLIKCIAPQAKA